MANQTLPPLPYRSPLLDNAGYLTQAWSVFFRQLFERVGGSVAPSNSDIVAVSDELDALTLTVGTIDSDLTTLEGTVLTQAGLISALQVVDNDFGQGRAL